MFTGSISRYLFSLSFVFERNLVIVSAGILRVTCGSPLGLKSRMMLLVHRISQIGQSEELDLYPSEIDMF